MTCTNLVPRPGRPVRSVTWSQPNASGFTLIELMIVVAVVALLVAIAVPSYQDQVRKSRRAQAKADLAELMQIAERHHTVNNTYTGFALPFSQSPREAGSAKHYGFVIEEQSATDLQIVAEAEGGQANDKCGDLSLSNKGVKLPLTPDECW